MARVIALCILVFLFVAASADTLTGKVAKVADDDTITVLDNTNTQHRIRLQGIDAPERGQPFGNPAAYIPYRAFRRAKINLPRLNPRPRRAWMDRVMQKVEERRIKA